MTGRPAASGVGDGEAALSRAIETVESFRAILDRVRAGALPHEFWLLARSAFADAAYYREPGDCLDCTSREDLCGDHARDERLRKAYLDAMDAIGGPPEGDPWAVLSSRAA